MERFLQGPIDPCFLEENWDVECLNQAYIDTDSLRIEGEEGPHFSSTSSLEDKMPFLQMLQSMEYPTPFPFKEPNFQTLLRLQYIKKPWDINPWPYMSETETHVQALELESCVTHDIVDLHSPVKSETKDFQNPHANSCIEGATSEPNQEPSKIEPCSMETNSGASIPWKHHPQIRQNETQFPKPSPVVGRERKKRKRARPTKNKEEVESQRMTHIAVERNRRRQMNDHLNSLRSLMPPSYVQRGDQASIVGGAIDFVKELEQLLQSMEAQKRMRKAEEVGGGGTDISSNGLLLQCDNIARECGSVGEEEAKVEKKREAAEIEVTTIQNHVNLKIQCRRSPGQLLRAIVALEDLRLTVLHLNITSSQSTVLYSFNLKIEEDCKLGTASEVAGAVHQVFNIINGS